MNWIVAVFVGYGVVRGKFKCENEYREFMELEDAKAFADRRAEELGAGNNEGYNIRIYELTNY